MTFETLLYIHRLLKEEEATCKENYKKARDYLNELKDQEASPEDIAQAKAAKEYADRIHTKAIRALNEFSCHEWR